MSDDADSGRPNELIRKYQTLLSLLTVRQVIAAGDAAIEAAGLNPWAINEGRATGDETISTWWVESDLNDLLAAGRRSGIEEAAKMAVLPPLDYSGWVTACRETYRLGIDQTRAAIRALTSGADHV